MPGPTYSRLPSTSGLWKTPLSGLPDIHTLEQIYEGKGFAFEAATLAANRTTLKQYLEFYSNELNHTNIVLFNYLSAVQREAMLRRLRYTFYLLSAQYYLDEAEGRKAPLKQRKKEIEQCTFLLYKLYCSDPKLKPGTKEAEFADQLRKLSDESEKNGKIGGFFIGKWIADKIVALSEAAGLSQDKTDFIIKWMNETNSLRLGWLWDNLTLNVILQQLTPNFFNTNQAYDVINMPAPTATYLSWILYFCRFGLQLTLLLKHTIAGPWMNNKNSPIKESDIPFYERFRTQWHLRKFTLINDLVWGFANFVCCFWLLGNGLLGYSGGLFTVALLIMDVFIIIWQFYEASTEHNKAMLNLETDKEILEADLAAINTSLLSAEENEKGELEEKRDLIKGELDAIEKMQKKRQFQWTFTKYHLTTDLMYSVGLVIAFTLFCCLFIPPAQIALLSAVTVFAISLTGAVLCASLTILCAAIHGSLDLIKLVYSHKESQEQCEQLLKRFKDEPEEVQKQMYLEIKRLAHSDPSHYKKVLAFEAVKLIRLILIDVLAPVLIFTTLVFLPLGIGLGVLAAGLALVVLSKALITMFKPKEEELPTFNQSQFEAFQKKPELSTLRNNRFFPVAPKVEPIIQASTPPVLPTKGR